MNLGRTLFNTLQKSVAIILRLSHTYNIPCLHQKHGFSLETSQIHQEDGFTEKNKKYRKRERKK